MSARSPGPVLDSPGPGMTLRTSIQPQLWVDDGPAALRFYQRAFDAVVEHRVGETALVAQLAVGEARFWIASADRALGRFSPRAIAGTTGRLLLVITDPERVLAAAVAAGATERSPVHDEHGWRVARFEDPFGHEWEVGHQLGLTPPDAAS